MFLTIESARLPWWVTFSRLDSNILVSSLTSPRIFSSSSTGFSFSVSSSTNSATGEIVYEIERVLDLMSDTCGELAQRRQLLGLHEAVLHSAQIVERMRKLPCSGPPFVEEDQRSGSRSPPGRQSSATARYLSCGKGTDFLAIDCEHPDEAVVFAERH